MLPNAPTEMICLIDTFNGGHWRKMCMSNVHTFLYREYLYTNINIKNTFTLFDITTYILNERL